MVYSKDYNTQYLTEGLYAGDYGYRIVMRCDKDLTGCSVSVSVLRSDGGCVTEAGWCEGKIAYCILPASALAVAGKWEARVCVTDGDYFVTVSDIVGTVSSAIDGGDVSEDDRYPILTSLITQAAKIQSEYEALMEEGVGTDNIQDAAVTTDKLADESVTEAKLADGAVTEEKIASKAVTTAKLDDEAVTRAKIMDGAVNEDKIADGAVTSVIIADGAVTNAKIESLIDTSSDVGAVWGYIPFVKTDGGMEIGQYADFHIASDDGIDRYARIRIYDDDGVPRFKLEGSSASVSAHLTAANITASQFHGTHYGTLGYPLKITLNGTTYNYTASSSSAASCAEALVFYAANTAGTEGYLLLANSEGVPEWTDTLPSTTKFNTASGVAVSIAAFYAAFTNAVNSLTAEISNLTVTTEMIEDGAVTGDKIASGTITAANIKDGAIVAGYLADEAVYESSNIRDGIITNEKLADGSVTADKIAEPAVTTAKLVDGSVTEAKLADEVAEKLNYIYLPDTDNVVHKGTLEVVDGVVTFVYEDEE